MIDVGEQFLAGSLAKRCPQEGYPIASLFNQLLQHFPRTEFAALVKKHAAERAAKGFTCWTQLVSMLFCQLGLRRFAARDLQRPRLLPRTVGACGDCQGAL